MLESLARLPLRIDGIALEQLSSDARRTTVVTLHSGGEVGRGEDVTHDEPDRAAFRALDLSPLRAATTLGRLADALDRLELDAGTSWPVVRSYRRWALESASLDLALRAAAVSLADALGMQPAPVRFVVSLRVASEEAVLAQAANRPDVRLKLDARASWTPATIAALAATGAVEIVDLKGTAPGSSVYEPAHPRRYERLAAAFPEALFEDPAPELASLLPRVSWDEPVQRVRDLDRLPGVDAVNVKPARLGSLAATIALVEECRARAISLYGGGHSELGPGRGQAQLLASLLYADAPNDLAPADVVMDPLVPPSPQVTGFRWA